MENNNLKEYVIYEITNKIDSKKYIGCSTNYKKRALHHKSKLVNGAHPNKHLQRAWDKHGSDNFEFSILYTLGSSEAMYELEADLIDHHSKDFYNLCAGGKNAAKWNASSPNASLIISKYSNTNRGKKRTPEQCARISQGKWKPCSIMGIAYPSLKAAAEVTGFQEGTVSYRIKSFNFHDYYYL